MRSVVLKILNECAEEEDYAGLRKLCSINALQQEKSQIKQAYMDGISDTVNFVINSLHNYVDIQKSFNKQPTFDEVIVKVKEIVEEYIPQVYNCEEYYTKHYGNEVS